MGINWFVYALLGMVFFSGMILIFKKLVVAGLKPNVILFFIFTFGMLFYLTDIIYNKTSISINYYFLGFLILAAFLSYLGNLLYVKSLSTAPNPGYTTAINSLQIILITIGSFLLFGSGISAKNIVGIVLGLIAIILLTL